MENYKMYSTLQNLHKPIAIVAHDAGGANQIIALLQNSEAIQYIRPYVAGPALKLWQQAFPDMYLYPSLQEVLCDSKTLISGSGWASNLEYNAINLANNMGIYTITLLDHWINYKDRFIRNSHRIKPNELWVVDKYAAKKATLLFPNQTIQQLPDFYLQSQLQQITPPKAKNPTLLYVLEPTRSYWGKDQLGEFQALTYMLEKIHKMQLPDNVLILLRPHPSENKEKYQDWIKKHPTINLAFDHSPTLADAISKAQWVAGCESYALVVALASGRVVFSTLPPWAPSCRLPHDGLIQIKNL